MWRNLEGQLCTGPSGVALQSVEIEEVLHLAGGLRRLGQGAGEDVERRVAVRPMRGHATSGL